MAMDKINYIFPDIPIIKIHYEDLCKNTSKTLNNIYKYLNLENIETIDNIKIDSHNISGSRWRYDNKIHIKLDDKYLNHISINQKIINAILSPIISKYNY